jgi:hypothetical protein
MAKIDKDSSYLDNKRNWKQKRMKWVESFVKCYRHKFVAQGI